MGQSSLLATRNNLTASSKVSKAALAAASPSTPTMRGHSPSARSCADTYATLCQNSPRAAKLRPSSNAARRDPMPPAHAIAKASSAQSCATSPCASFPPMLADADRNAAVSRSTARPCASRASRSKASASPQRDRRQARSPGRKAPRSHVCAHVASARPNNRCALANCKYGPATTAEIAKESSAMGGGGPTPSVASLRTVKACSKSWMASNSHIVPRA
mmetsp:Transcript_5474/g.15779  ORF Transcript_5474/g.15779 Transcript_5474/m.15779 type:complete len:218 (+) Transcript_5474:497-1150(+)